MPYVQTGIEETLYQRFLGQVESGRLMLDGPRRGDG